jgi:2-keto-4-pentenoate hydratase/2-oxohepta-3-ene-1,7-dioic acid hydratase in catechol pathway
MPIFRYADPEGVVHHGLLHADGSRERLEGALFTTQRPSGEAAQVVRLLAPIEPRALLCIGLNYRRHAAETGAAIPQRPVLFMKSPGAVQDPEAPIELPTVSGDD